MNNSDTDHSILAEIDQSIARTKHWLAGAMRELRADDATLARMIEKDTEMASRTGCVKYQFVSTLCVLGAMHMLRDIYEARVDDADGEDESAVIDERDHENGYDIGGEG